ncbi:AfsR/SARP family transcriptional regulator [Actinoalloteichus caeruleus]|uniref:AfsR/SARP family transcriptional regulator n=1 Tax=Actinoalloteichus cyanogriseus TaxID=2893586 RepID=UPI0004AB229C|nr:AfsR/SARP family transcriptional regulator [Actinoalloteichus caeruleus]
MRFRVLGPLRVRRDDSWVPVGAPKWRSLLAVLLINRDLPVSTSRLVDELWGETPPTRANDLVRNYVMRLRRFLGADGGTLLVREPAGYRLRCPPEDVDSEVFRHQVAEGVAELEAGDPALATALLRDALDLWSGEPLADVVPSPSVTAARRALGERRDLALDHRIEADLATGEHVTLTVELRRLLSENPWRERRWGQLMRVLHASGRRTEALEAYREFYGMLRDQQGVSPSRDLVELHQAILTAGHQHAPTEPAPPARGVGSARRPTDEVDAFPVSEPVYQLPADIADFTGRAEQLRTLRSVLAESAPGTAVPVAAICGPPGVGKTALALHTAHQLRSWFPDGQLYIRLGGGSGHPKEPIELLGEILRALGVPPGLLPASLEERASLYRSRLADRRVLLVLDDAGERPESLEPLIPGTAGCSVLITCRFRLTGLAGMRYVQLGPLSNQESYELLGLTIGRHRAARESGAAHEIVARYEGLPLAIRVVAGKLASTPHLPLAAFLRGLRAERTRLDSAEDGGTGVRAAISATYDALTPVAARSLDTLGVLHTETVSDWMFRLLAPWQADRALDELVSRYLLDIDAPGYDGWPVYRFHSLLRDYARERLFERDVDERRDVLRRLVAGVRQVAERAADRAGVYPTLPRPRAVTARPVPEETVRTIVEAPWEWLLGEKRTLSGVVADLVGHGLLEEAVGLLDSVRPYFESLGRQRELTALWRLVADALPGDDPLLPRARLAVAAAIGEFGDFSEARRLLEDVLRRHAGSLEPTEMLQVRLSLGYCHAGLRDQLGALREFRAFTALAERVDGVAPTLVVEGLCCEAGALTAAGRTAEADELFDIVESRLVAVDDPRCELRYLHGRTQHDLRLGEVARALRRAERGVELARSLHTMLAEITFLGFAGEARSRLGDHDQALSLLGAAHRRCVDIGHQSFQAMALTRLAEAHERAGAYSLAEETATRAVTLWRQLRADRRERTATEILARVRQRCDPRRERPSAAC